MQNLSCTLFLNILVLLASGCGPKTPPGQSGSPSAGDVWAFAKAEAASKVVKPRDLNSKIAFSGDSIVVVGATDVFLSKDGGEKFEAFKVMVDILGTPTEVEAAKITRAVGYGHGFALAFSPNRLVFIDKVGGTLMLVDGAPADLVDTVVAGGVLVMRAGAQGWVIKLPATVEAFDSAIHTKSLKDHAGGDIIDMAKIGGGANGDVFVVTANAAAVWHFKPENLWKGAGETKAEAPTNGFNKFGFGKAAAWPADASGETVDDVTATKEGTIIFRLGSALVTGKMDGSGIKAVAVAEVVDGLWIDDKKAVYGRISDIKGLQKFDSTAGTFSGPVINADSVKANKRWVDKSKPDQAYELGTGTISAYFHMPNGNVVIASPTVHVGKKIPGKPRG